MNNVLGIIDYVPIKLFSWDSTHEERIYIYYLAWVDNGGLNNNVFENKHNNRVILGCELIKMLAGCDFKAKFNCTCLQEV